MTTQAKLNVNERAALSIHLISDAIQKLETVPSGYLYARIMDHISFESYQTIILLLKASDLISVKNDLIVWKGKK